eukprot:INCI12529.1.p1 GENE.INCI12529.1~~INCI12529.1.p1  ORF type:complete len:485 (-),score=80.48 INCI12529.1:100-1554(-)
MSRTSVDGAKPECSCASQALARIFGKWITWHAPNAKVLLSACLVAAKPSTNSATRPSQCCISVKVELWGSGVQICDNLSVSSADSVAELRRQIAFAWRRAAPSSIRVFVESGTVDNMDELLDMEQTLEQAGIGEGSKVVVSTRRLELQGHERPVLSACIVADGSFVATASRDRSVVLWSLKDGTQLIKMCFDAPVFAVFPVAKSQVVALLGNREVVFANQTGVYARMPCSHPFHANAPTKKMATLPLGNDTCFICVGDRWAHLNFFSVSRKDAVSAATPVMATNQLHVMPSSASLAGLSLLKVDFTTACLAVACRQEGFFLFDFDLQRAGMALAFNLTRRCSVSVDDDATDVGLGHSASCPFMVTATMNTTACLWHWKTGAFHALLRGHNAPVLCCGFTSCDKMAVTGAANGCVRLWKADSGEPLRSLGGHSRAVVGLLCVADDRDDEFCAKHEDALGLRGELVVTASLDKLAIVQPLLVPLTP